LGFARKYSLRTLGIAGDREGREVRTEIEHMREALASYIEATYHLSNPKVVELRRRLLMQGGIVQTPYIESTPAYVGDRKFASLALDKTVRECLTNLASKDSDQLLFDPVWSKN
jgi:hypothetical protein